MLVALAVLAVYNLRVNQQLESDIAELKAGAAGRDAAIAEAKKAAVPAGSAVPLVDSAAKPQIEKRIQSLEERVERANAKIASVAEWNGEIEKKITDFKPGSPETAAGGAPGAAPTREEVAALVEKKVKEAKANSFYTKKPPFDKFVQVLALDEKQADSAYKSVTRGQAEVLELLKLPRKDGGCFADDLADAFLSQDEARVKKLFLTLVSTKVPDREETYFAEIMKRSERIKEEFKEFMTPEQYNEYASSVIEPMDIEIKGNPIEQYLLERAKDRQIQDEGR
jgi:hypothetical protein